MFMQAYDDVLEDEQGSLRHGEGAVIERTINMMKESDAKSTDGMLRTRAIHFTIQVWSYLLNDLSSTDNATPKELKATLISIGIFMLKHLESMRQDRTIAFEPIVDISQTIREGLN